MTDDPDTPQQRRDRFLRLAADAEATAFRMGDPKTKKAWADIARSWTAMAKKIPPDDH